MNPQVHAVGATTNFVQNAERPERTDQEVADDGWQVETSRATRRLQKRKSKSRKRPASPPQEIQIRPAVSPAPSPKTVGPSSGQYDSISEFMSNPEDPYLPQPGRVRLAMPPQPQQNDSQVAESQSETLVGTTSTYSGPPYRCRHADCKSTAKPFNKRSDRNKHEYSHVEFKCQTCRHSFKSGESLDKHWAKHHTSAPPPPLPTCPNCSKTFTRPDNRLRHVKAETCTSQRGRRANSNVPSTVSSRTAVTPTPQGAGIMTPPPTEKIPRTASFEAFPPLGTPIDIHARKAQ